MKYLLLLFFLSSCSRYQTLKGKYPESPIQSETKLSFEKAWEKCLDVFTEKNIPIKIIDKSSGIIVSEKIKLLTTMEDPKGGLINKNAYIVVPSFYDPGEKRNTTRLPLDSYAGSITVRIKQKENGVLVFISIAEVAGQGYLHVRSQNGDADFRSTGKFEQGFFELLK